MSALALGLILGQLLGGGGPGLSNAFTIGDRTEFRVRSVPTGTSNRGRVAEDIETTLLSSAVVHRPRSEYVLGYTPRLVYNDFEGDRNLSLMHVGHAAASFWSRHLRVAIAIDGSIGQQSAVALNAPITYVDISSATPTPKAPPVSYLPYLPELQTQVLTLGMVHGSLGATYAFSRRWSSTLSGYYVMQGGFDFYSQQVLPPSRGPGAEVSVGYLASRRATFTTRLLGNEITVLRTPVLGYFRHTGGTFVTATAMESLSYKFGRRTSAGLGGGASFLSGPRTIDGRSVAVLDGAGEVTLAQAMPLRGDALLTLQGSASVTSVYNNVLGVAQQQGTASLATTLAKRRIDATLVLGFATSIPTPLGDPEKSRTASGSVAFGYTPVPILTLQTGFRGFYQVLAPQVIGPDGVAYDLPDQGVQWALFVAAQITTAPIGF